MKAKKAIKRLNKAEALLANVLDGYAGMEAGLRALLDTAKATVGRAKDAIGKKPAPAEKATPAETDTPSVSKKKTKASAKAKPKPKPKAVAKKKAARKKRVKAKQEPVEAAVEVETPMPEPAEIVEEPEAIVAAQE